MYSLACHIASQIIALAGCGKLTVKVRTSGTLPVCLVIWSKPDRPYRPNEQDRLTGFLRIRLYLQRQNLLKLLFNVFR